MRSCQSIKNQRNHDLIEIIQFCFKIYDFVETSPPMGWCMGSCWVDGWGHAKVLKIMDILLTFWHLTFSLSHLSPLQGCFLHWYPGFHTCPFAKSVKFLAICGYVSCHVIWKSDLKFFVSFMFILHFAYIFANIFPHICLCLKAMQLLQFVDLYSYRWDIWWKLTRAVLSPQEKIMNEPPKCFLTHLDNMFATFLHQIYR